MERNLKVFLKEFLSHRCDHGLAKLVEVVGHPIDGVHTAAALDGAVEDLEDVGVQHLGGDRPGDVLRLAALLRAGVRLLGRGADGG